jgi:ribosomal protein L7Ae-like RNA K-turn-binding protein
LKLDDIIRLAYKAGKLSIGRTQVMKSIRKSKLIIMTYDFSSKEKLVKVFKKLKKPFLIVNKSKVEIGEVLSRGEVGIISINDENFFKLLKRRLEDDMVGCWTSPELSWDNR